jgi:hypothetical protein
MRQAVELRPGGGVEKQRRASLLAVLTEIALAVAGRQVEASAVMGSITPTRQPNALRSIS